MSECPCQLEPMESKCGVWDGNTSACLCADMGIWIETNRPLPS